MLAFLIRRAMQSVGVLLAVSVVVFIGVYAVGNPARILLPDDATGAEYEQAVQNLGLDQPLPAQFVTFLGNALRGDLGTSFVFNMPSIQLILARLPATLELALTAMLLAILLGIPLGLLAGLKPGSKFDETVVTGSILGFSMPNFWQGMMLIMVFSVGLGVLPANGRGETGTLLGVETSFATVDGVRHLVLPALNLALFKIALMIRLTRTGVREVIALDYVKFARAKGLGERRVLFVHVLKNIMVPIVTIVGMEFGSLIAFATITETIFAWPGMGKLLIDSINSLDRPVVVAYVMVVTLMFVLINLLVDFAYSALDPRVRLRGATS